MIHQGESSTGIKVGAVNKIMTNVSKLHYTSKRAARGYCRVDAVTSPPSGAGSRVRTC